MNKGGPIWPFLRLRDCKANQPGISEWESQRETSLAGLWPTTSVPWVETLGTNAAVQVPLSQWVDFFNARQLLVHSQLLKAILRSGKLSLKLALQHFQRFSSTFAIAEYVLHLEHSS